MKMLSYTHFLLSVPWWTLSQALQCPSGWSQSHDNQRCYMVLQDSMYSFTNCVNRCEYLGASTPCIRNSLDNNELTELTQAYGAWWVGLFQSPTRDYRTQLGWDQWAAVNCTSNYQSWDYYEPNDWNCIQENCAIANKALSGRRVTSRFRWLDEPCDVSQWCVCQWPGTPTEGLSASAGGGGYQVRLPYPVPTSISCAYFHILCLP